MKGHAKEVHIERGITTRLDKHANDAADKLASDAAAHHAAPDSLTTAAERRKGHAKAFHLLAAEILGARSKALEVIAVRHGDSFPSEADHG